MAGGYDGPIIDIDIHHRPKHVDEWVPYISPEWRLEAAGRLNALYPIQMLTSTEAEVYSPNGYQRRDLFEEQGVIPGYSLERLRTTLLEPSNVWRGILTHDIGQFTGGINPYFTADLCRGVNDWNLETWLSGDPRLYGLVAVPPALPEIGAREIRRVGGHEKYAGVLLASNSVGRQFGDPLFDPIYAAATEVGLPILVHSANLDRNPVQAGGTTSSLAERLSQQGQKAMHMIASFIVHGTFEKFPELNVLIVEFGFSWLPSFLWRMDGEYELLRRESPWVKKPPSEYVRDHIFFATQPLEDAPGRHALRDLMQTIDGVERMLCFSSDYPHYTMDDRLYLARLLPLEWHRSVFCENAARAFGWTAPPAGFKMNLQTVAQPA